MDLSQLWGPFSYTKGVILILDSLMATSSYPYQKINSETIFAEQSALVPGCLHARDDLHMSGGSSVQSSLRMIWRMRMKMQMLFWVLCLSLGLMLRQCIILMLPQWHQAALDELAVHKSNDTWHLVKGPKEYRVIGFKLVFKVRHNADGSIDNYKGCLVAKGYN